jgi:PhnB protein
MRVRPIPDGFHTIVPNIIVNDAEKAIGFYKIAFGAEEKLRLTMPDGKIAHCELIIGDSVLNLGQAMEGWPVHPLLAQLFVGDCDAFFKRAVDAGAKVTMPMADMFFGHRAGHVVHPFGGTWIISTQKEVVAPEEMQRMINQAGS